MAREYGNSLTPDALAWMAGELSPEEYFAAAWAAERVIAHAEVHAELAARMRAQPLLGRQALQHQIRPFRGTAAA